MPLLFLVLAAVLGVGFVWMLFVSARRARPEIDSGTGTLTFRHGRLLRMFAAFALFAAPAAVAAWAVIYPPRSGALTAGLVLAAAGLALIGAILSWEAFRFALIVSDSELDCRSPWRTRRVVPWEQVTRVEFSPANAWFTLRFADGKAFRVPAVVPGVGHFLAACERHLKSEQLNTAKGGYPLVGRTWPFPAEDKR